MALTSGAQGYHSSRIFYKTSGERSVSVRAKNSDQLQTHLPLKRRHERFLLRLFN
ncbi:MAG: hypothetical protein LOY03_03705 [Cyclobacteriaceae bacterium]|nr:hypothetical protein [Cyclobacteriaceae bacterium]